MDLRGDILPLTIMVQWRMGPSRVFRLFENSMVMIFFTLKLLHRSKKNTQDLPCLWTKLWCQISFTKKNMSLEKGSFLKRKGLSSNHPFFRWYVSFRGKTFLHIITWNGHFQKGDVTSFFFSVWVRYFRAGVSDLNRFAGFLNYDDWSTKTPALATYPPRK